jgi:hypothetical protein
MKYRQPPGTPENTSYQDFNPAQGIDGSVVPAYAVESPMREIVNAIAEAGLVPADGDLTQLHQAIVAIVTQAMGAAGGGAAASLSASRSDDYEEGDAYPVPAYTPGNNELAIFRNGFHCAQGQQYAETAADPDTGKSTTITLMMDLPKKMPMNVYVRP